MDSKNKNKNGKEDKKKTDTDQIKTGHLGSSNAFEQTENPLSRDDDNVSDEKLDEMLDD